MSEPKHESELTAITSVRTEEIERAHMTHVKMKLLWRLAEQMDWNGRWPKPLWRWLLKRLDRLNGHCNMDYDY